MKHVWKKVFGIYTTTVTAALLFTFFWTYKTQDMTIKPQKTVSELFGVK